MDDLHCRVLYLPRFCSDRGQSAGKRALVVSMKNRVAIQCDLSPELFKRYTALREKLGLSNRSFMERILLDALPRWDKVRFPGDAP